MQLISSADDALFLQFQQDVSDIALPERFTFPFCYEPHQLAKIAATELQNHITNINDANFEFDLGDNPTGIDKMFGVLVVKDKEGNLGYLVGFSGKIGDKTHYPFFVPPIFDTLAQEGFFKLGEKEIKKVNLTVDELLADPALLTLRQQLVAYEKQAEKELNEAKEAQKQGKAARAEKRIFAETISDEDERNQLLWSLDKQSFDERTAFKHNKNRWRALIEQTQKDLAEKESPINQLKEKRKKMSFDLQHRLFESYTFLNIDKKIKTVADIFSIAENGWPPSGAGECAAPKLLQYAFANGYFPVALAEFWWGVSPASEIRKHGYFYPACKSKCLPILTHMLDGMTIDTDPTTISKAANDDLEICYEDDDLVVINKPQELLSVPGTKIDDSVYLRMKNKYPEATGPLIVHRLDQSTSGLMIIPKKLKVYHHLQRQFFKKTIKKRYVALLDGIVSKKGGKIDLPIRVDLDNRPRQLVCYEHGKPALTKWELVEYHDNKTRVNFYPISGRTHQLRVHAAHLLGLNTPIVGDDLYGTRNQRLCLHAEEISFVHPTKRKRMTIMKKADF